VLGLARVLVIEDEENLRLSVVRTLTKASHELAEASCLRDARELLHKQDFDLVLTDVMLGSENGVDLVRELRADGYDGVVVVITAFGTVESAVAAMRDGADHYLQKPISMQDLQMQVERALKHQHTARRLRLYERLVQSTQEGQDVIGESDAWKRTLAFAARLAEIPLPPASPAKAAGSGAGAAAADPSIGLGMGNVGLPTVLLLGETGVGKGVLARYIHARAVQVHRPAVKRLNGGSDPDAAPPFVHVNCSALPATLVEAELFGHEKGAFTDASEARPGLFEMADGGTIFLDEISEMPIELQAKLLLVVEQGTFRRVGGTRERRVRTRIIAASNLDLEERARSGQFRRDLLYRLNAFTVKIPALRERGEDAVLIARAALDRLSRRYGKPSISMTPAAEEAVRHHNWPGNVRELLNAVQRAQMLCDRPSVEAFDLGLANAPERVQTRVVGIGSDGLVFDFENGVHTLEEVERALVMQALLFTKGNVSRAARLIGLQRSSLRYRIEQYQLERYVSEVAKQ
jgi:two-component system, NtrC family, response regulator AtoC